MRNKLTAINNPIYSRFYCDKRSNFLENLPLF
ncbi:hypothetical protein MHA_1641 [Mannheimia haemolytica PHL213]|nr:hypothetical protein MHA_1641 [Mannheimia haemolytica PHL213]